MSLPDIVVVHSPSGYTAHGYDAGGNRIGIARAATPNEARSRLMRQLEIERRKAEGGGNSKK